MEKSSQALQGSGIVNFFAAALAGLWARRSGGEIGGVVNPQAEGVGSGVAVRCGGETMTFGTEEGSGLVMDREEALHLAGEFEAAMIFSRRRV
jgi:hypothetical protein